jgi:hypothetical protein
LRRSYFSASTSERFGQYVNVLIGEQFTTSHPRTASASASAPMLAFIWSQGLVIRISFG